MKNKQSTPILSMGNRKPKNAESSVLKRLNFSILSLLIILFLATSCGRNVGSGCGTWPGLSSNSKSNYHGNYGKPSYSNKQYSYYRRY